SVIYAIYWWRSTRSSLRRPTDWMSPTSLPARGRSRANFAPMEEARASDDLCATVAAPAARGVTAVVVVARASSRSPRRCTDEWRAAGDGPGGTAVDCPVAHLVALGVPGRMDCRGRGPTAWLRESGDPERGHLHRTRRRCVEQYARGRLLSCEPARRGPSYRDGIRACPCV